MAGRIQKDISSAHDAAVVTPSDSTILPAGVRGLWIGVTGDLAVRMVGGGSVTFTNVPAGVQFPIQVDMVLAATTADEIVALY